MSHRCLHFAAPALFRLHLRSISGTSGQQPYLFSGSYPQRPAGIALSQAAVVPWTARFGQCWTSGSFRFCGQIDCTRGWRFDPVGLFIFFLPPSLPTTHVNCRSSFSCQCGISRSGTLIIALVMRAAARCSTAVPSQVWALKGMQGAYSYVKEKSKWVGPNMSYVISFTQIPSSG